MHGLVRCTHWVQVFTRVRADVTITDVTIKTPEEKWDRGREWRYAPEWWAEDLGIWKKTNSKLRFRLGRSKSIFGARRGQTSSLRRGAARGGVRWKSQDRKKLCLFLLMSKKKVNKSFVPEPKKRVVNVLSVFGFLYAYEYYIDYEHYERFMHVNILVVFLDVYIYIYI